MMNGAGFIPNIESRCWRVCTFDELSVYELHDIYRARQQVFAVEQNCVYLDVDGVDEAARHVSAWSTTSRSLLAYARVIPPGIKYADASIGRVLTTTPARGTGLGRELVRRAIALCESLFPDFGIRISAQSHLEAFYGEAGFEIVGERYMEDGIAHTEMLRAKSTRARRR